MFIHFVDNFIYGFGLVKTSNNIIKKLKHSLILVINLKINS